MTNAKKTGGSKLALATVSAPNWPPASLTRVNDPYYKWSRTVMFDLHGVVFDWESAFQDFASAHFGYSFNGVKREFYDMARDPNTPISPDQFSELFLEFVRRATGGYGDLSPLPGVVEQMELLKEAGINIVICTWTPGATDARPDGSATVGTGIAQRVTEELILKHLGHVVHKSNILFSSTHAKKRVMLEERIPLIVEDNAETAVGVAQSALGAIVMPQPYNEGLAFPNVLRLDSSNQLAHAVLSFFDKLDDENMLAPA
ncbi:MAG: hypothetical protein LCH63_21365 [Candidatus Melainabacteria bacterium]|jgi:hypothetical protein|nr:hypothetical protein [Candidatus Obscuribacterales bacterium]MCA0316384.1 hypothetical protein [Candidatus Melainabacteria bacterium]